MLYTDGVTEALDSEGEEFGMANVIKAIQASASDGAAGIITRLTDDLRAFVGNQPQYDDITLIVIRKKMSNDTTDAAENSGRQIR